MTITTIVAAFLIAFFGYLFLQYKTYTNPPNIVITNPIEGAVVATNEITLAGKTDADAVISVNNIKIATNDKGEFQTEVSLSPGINTILIEAVSKSGKKRTIQRTIQLTEK